MGVDAARLEPTAEDDDAHASASLRKFLKACRPDWSWQSICVVASKLSRVGVRTTADLQESVRLGSLNQLLREAGEKCFSSETLRSMRHSLQAATVHEAHIDDEYRAFEEPRYFRVAVRCVAVQCHQRLDAKNNAARYRGEVVEAVGRAGSWLRLAALEGILDGAPEGEALWLQISSSSREDGRVAREAETALLTLRGICPEALGPISDSGAGLCSSVEEVRGVFARAVHTQQVLQRCSGVRRPALGHYAANVGRLARSLRPTLHAPGSGTPQARREPGSRVVGLGRWRIFAARGHGRGELVELCPLLAAAMTVGPGSVLDQRMRLGVPRSLPLGLGCLYRRGDAEANACMRLHEGVAAIETMREVLVGEELVLASEDLRGASHAVQAAEGPWVAGRVGLTAGAARAGRSSVHGRGVFAACAFAEGDVVELCPGLVLDDASQGVLQDFAMLFFEHGGPWGDVPKAISVIPLGNGALYNHRNPGYNVEWGWLEGFDIIEMRAARDVEEGEELFISYGSGYWSARRVPE